MGNIYHKWDGTILTITSDSGTSSADLRGEKGDDGIRGPQGAPGIGVEAAGSTNFYVAVQMGEYSEDEGAYSVTWDKTIEEIAQARNAGNSVIAQAFIDELGFSVDVPLCALVDEDGSAVCLFSSTMSIGSDETRCISILLSEYFGVLYMTLLDGEVKLPGALTFERAQIMDTYGDLLYGSYAFDGQMPFSIYGIPNPYKIRITQGDSTCVYDGSAEANITIPTNEEIVNEVLAALISAEEVSF